MKYQTIEEAKQDHPHILDARARKFLGYDGEAYLNGHCLIVHHNLIEEDEHYTVYALTKTRAIFLDKALSLPFAQAVTNAYNLVN